MTASRCFIFMYFLQPHWVQPRADQHQGGVAVRECPHHAGPSADLTVQPLDHVVGADTLGSAT